jgi:hypothetical protein
MMHWKKGTTALAVLAVVASCGTGVILTFNNAQGHQAAKEPVAADIQQKAQARVQAAENVLTFIDKRIEAGAEPLTPSFIELRGRAQRRLAEAQIDAAADTAARRRAAERYVQQSRESLAQLEKRMGQDVTQFGLAQARYEVADAEYLLAKIIKGRGQGDL